MNSDTPESSSHSEISKNQDGKIHNEELASDENARSELPHTGKLRPDKFSNRMIYPPTLV